MNDVQDEIRRVADTLRTDRARLRPLVPDTGATVAPRRTCRAREDLVSHRVAVANLLRAHLRDAVTDFAADSRRACWQQGRACDPEVHRALQRVLTQNRAA